MVKSLIERQFAVENVAAGETVLGFEVLRRDDLRGFDQARRNSGEYAAMVLMTASPRSVRRESHVPFFNLKGANCT